jgi:hypothetical protein
VTARSNQEKTMPKTIYTAGTTGQRGINAIERIVLESGSRWTNSGDLGGLEWSRTRTPGFHRSPLRLQRCGIGLATTSKTIGDRQTPRNFVQDSGRMRLSRNLDQKTTAEKAGITRAAQHIVGYKVYEKKALKMSKSNLWEILRFDFGAA